ncbi:MAG: response regulator [Bryobacteraceae bacterium]|jgi:CheY-like chemotaxis protein
MNSDTILTLMDYLCNEARNAMHATFGLMEFYPEAEAGPEWHTCLRASRTSADRLLGAIDDMRELVGGAPPAPGSVEDMDLTLCADEIADLLNLAVENGGARLVVEPGGAPARIRQNRQALEQSLVRILKLALKLSRSGVVRVTVSACREDRVCLRVVPPSYDLARQLAGWMNADDGELQLEEADVGSIVSAAVAGRRLRTLGANTEFACDSTEPTGLAICLQRQAVGCTEEPSTEAAGPLQILVAEDCDESYALTELLLRSESVDRAHTGLEAIDKVKQRRFDVVFMDIHMPGLDGYDTIREIRGWETRSGNARTPIVILSSDDVGTQTRSAAQSGCSGFLRKPVRTADLHALLEPLRAMKEMLV